MSATAETGKSSVQPVVPVVVPAVEVDNGTAPVASANNTTSQPHEGNQLVADMEASEHGDDGDSAFGSEDDASHIKTNAQAEYAYPNDELEKDRLDLQHHLFKLMMDQRLYLAPISKNPQNVLDIGTGTGLWAIEFADDHPSANVIGTDLSAIQPGFVPPNLSFLIDDAKENWVFPNKFDFIHARQLHCAVEEKRLIEQALEHLTPGGFFEMQELAFPGLSDDGTQLPDSPLGRWNALMLEASQKIGMPLNNAEHYASWLKDAGFTNVHSTRYKWPTNTWPKGKKEKTMGLWNMVNTLDGLEGFTMAMFTRVLGWQPAEVQVFLTGVRRDVRDKRIHAYWPVYVTYGQKSEASG